MDQSSALGGGGLALVNEYDGPGQRPGRGPDGPSRRWATADNALLAGHGVFVLGGSARAVTSGPWPSNSGASGPGTSGPPASRAPSPLPSAFLDVMAASDGEGFIGFWEAAVRAELRADPALLD